MRHIQRRHTLQRRTMQIALPSRRRQMRRPRRSASQRITAHHSGRAGGSAAHHIGGTGHSAGECRSNYHCGAGRCAAEAQHITAAAQAAARRGPGEHGLNAYEIGRTRTSVVIFFYSELAAATAGFENSHRIGEGGFGSVYYTVQLRGMGGLPGHQEA